jgi:hypothetical protein
MTLDSYQSGVSLPLHLHTKDWYLKIELNVRQSEWQPSTWVKLQECLSPYSHDEALLLCQHSDTAWLAWIPDYGEVVLQRGQFTKIE